MMKMFALMMVLGVSFCGPVWACYTCEHVGGSASFITVTPDRAQRIDEDLKAHLRAYRGNPNDPKIWLEIGRDYLDLADADSWHYLDQAANFLKKVNDAVPNIPAVMMLLGRVEGARALDVKPSVLTRLKWARRGFKQMDRAVGLDPTCPFLRLLRAEAQLMAHPVLRRGQLLEEDAGVVMAQLKELAVNRFQEARVHLFLGSYFQRQKMADKAREHWQKAVELAAHTKVASEAEGRLKGSFKGLGYDEP